MECYMILVKVSGSARFCTVKRITNILTVVILYRGRCGLSRGITRYMVAMAISDLLVLIAHVLLREIYVYYSTNSILSRSSVCPSYIYLRIITLDYSVWLTVSFTFDRFVSICCPKIRHWYCTDRVAAVVVVSLCAQIGLKYIPFHFMYEPRFTKGDVKWGCRPRTAYFTSIGWLIFQWMTVASLSLLPFALMLILNGLTVRYIVAASRVRRHLKRGEGKDSETENRRKSIVLLFTVSGTSIVLWMTGTVTYICTRVTVNFVGVDLRSPSAVANEVGMLLIRVSSGANTTIYAMTQRKFRQEVAKVFKGLTRIIKPTILTRK
ncbi:probable G-protein coupled receptor 139 [Narcine bancroftii]|uniref:probable G-protein coupled receptor 139 n=1 Tax=Narcine bancroftii TaxID=1343680 RepID=UPI00383106E6